MNELLSARAALWKGKPRWIVDMRSRKQGRKIFKTQDKAVCFANEKNEELEKFGAMGVLSDDDRAQLVLAKSKLAGRATILQAVDFYLLHNASVESKPLKLALGECVAEKRKAECSKSYLRKLEYVVGSLADAVEKPVHEVTRDDVTLWLNGKGWAPATRRYNLADAGAFFKYCIGRGWAKVNPCAGMARIRADDKPPGILDVAQCSALLEAANRRTFRGLLGYVALALFAGIRPEEIQKMDWSLVDLERCIAEVPGIIAKSRKRRIVRLEPTAVAWLSICLRHGMVTPANFAAAFRDLRESCGLLEAWPHDCLRHSFASYHLAAFGSADKTATEMGHRSTDMLFRHYRELVKPDDAAKFWALRPNKK